MSDMFIAEAVTLTMVRAFTVEWSAAPMMLTTMAMAMAGAAIMWGVMRVGVMAGPGMASGPMGTVHLAVRLLFTYCVVADLIQVALLVTSHEEVTAESLFRAMLQMCQSIAGFSSLYLTICADPPPPPRTRKPVHA